LEKKYGSDSNGPVSLQMTKSLPLLQHLREDKGDIILTARETEKQFSKDYEKLSFLGSSHNQRQFFSKLLEKELPSLHDHCHQP
jgi:hypothetical protein